MQEILQKQGMIGGKQMRFRCRKTPINLLSIQVFGAGGAPQLQSKTVTPSTSQQTVRPDDGYDGLSSVQVNAISPTKGAETFTPNTQDQTISSGRWLTGTQTIKGDANLVASNIKSGVSIFGVSGSLDAYKQLQFTDVVATSSGLTISVGERLTRYSIVGIFLSSSELISAWDAKRVLIGIVSGIYYNSNDTRHDCNGVNLCGHINNSASCGFTALSNYLGRQYYSVSGTSITINCDKLRVGYKYEGTLYYS